MTSPVRRIRSPIPPIALRLLLWFGRHALTEAVGAESAARVRLTAPGLVPALVAQLPDLGKRPGARAFLVATCLLVAFHRALPHRSATDNTELFGRCLRALATHLPEWSRRIYRWVFFQPWYHRNLVAGVVGGGPQGFAGAFVPGAPGRSFGVDYHQCGIQIFLARIGQTDLGPHVCQLDVLEAELFGLGLVRDGTLSRGAKRCDFRWTRADALPPA